MRAKTTSTTKAPMKAKAGLKNKPGRKPAKAK
jgi:hypothetical protein